MPRFWSSVETRAYPYNAIAKPGRAGDSVSLASDPLSASSQAKIPTLTRRDSCLAWHLFRVYEARRYQHCLARVTPRLSRRHTSPRLVAPAGTAASSAFPSSRRAGVQVCEGGPDAGRTPPVLHLVQRLLYDFPMPSRPAPSPIPMPARRYKGRIVRVLPCSTCCSLASA